VVNNIRLPGQYYDAETGLHYNYHRYYDPKTGRYLTPDPIGLAGGINLYPYAFCNPISHKDDKGLFVDALLDVAFILWDLWDVIAADNPCERSESLTALGLDLAGLAVPFATGFGRGYKGLKALERTTLWRAVNESELADLSARAGAFRNPAGIINEYFSETAEGAASYARQAYQAGGILYEGPYTIVRTDIPSGIITPIMRATPDRGIATVVLPTELLPHLSPAQRLPFTPLPGRP
jgi:RHS repeat-associated protein